jgi:hypothetical protein
MNEIEELRAEIRRGLGLVRLLAILTFAAVLTLFAIIGGLSFVYLSNPPATISQEANPQISTTIEAPDAIRRIEERAAVRGYYYKSEFAEKMGVSEKTIDRWRSTGRLPDVVDDDGRVAIPLDSKLGD